MAWRILAIEFHYSQFCQYLRDAYSVHKSSFKAREGEGEGRKAMG